MQTESSSPLRLSQSRVLKSIESLPYGVLVVSSNGRILYANRASAKVLLHGQLSTPHGDLHALNFTPAWTAIRNALPGLKMIRDNPLTICYVNKFRQFDELSVCLAGLDAGRERHLLVVSRRDDNTHASSGSQHRNLLIQFAADCAADTSADKAASEIQPTPLQALDSSA